MFKQENYQDSIDVFMSFQTLNPGYLKLDYVQWMIAEAIFKSMPETIDRDLSMAYEAINSYTKLKADYPNSKYSKDVEGRLRECHSFIYDREMYIADFYYKTERYLSSSFQGTRRSFPQVLLSIIRKSLCEICKLSRK